MLSCEEPKNRERYVYSCSVPCQSASATVPITSIVYGSTLIMAEPRFGFVDIGRVPSDDADPSPGIASPSSYSRGPQPCSNPEFKLASL